MGDASPIIRVEGLVKRFGATEALRGLNLVVPEGTVLGLLGPNGAGKSTLVNVLTTLLEPDAGHAEVAGLDVVRQARQLRALIGLSGQYAAVDEHLTARENLEMFGRLYHLPGARARRRAAELLEAFDLVDAADRPLRTYSGGMRRRLDLAAGIIMAPPVLFLDDPTTGLDPRSRLAMWDMIRRLVEGGTTLLLTTQYLDEADQLANRIAVIDHGRVIAEGTPGELKSRIGGARLELTVARGGDLTAAVRALHPHSRGDIRIEADRRAVTAPVDNGPGLLVQIVRDLDAAGIPVDDLALRRATLDEVFLSLTGHAASTTPSEPDVPVELAEPVTAEEVA
ncbi:MAG TPA: ATP-binding cassette domain-containing protein [Thermomicrobiaceae bacterium]|nr:ATP-binding cassette domain-containing protein [Thermomicrobiaceae bacterium]